MCVSAPCFDIRIQVQGSVPMFHCLWQSVTGKPLLLDIACLFISFCGTHLSQMLWDPRPLWMMEYADPQQMTNLSAISVTVIQLSSWSRALTNSTLSAIHEVVWKPEKFLSTVLGLPLLNLSTHWYTFLRIMQFSPYCANILLWISEDFTPSDHKNWMTPHCSTMVQSESGANFDCTSFTECNGYHMTFCTYASM